MMYVKTQLKSSKNQHELQSPDEVDQVCCVKAALDLQLSQSQRPQVATAGTNKSNMDWFASLVSCCCFFVFFTLSLYLCM